MINSLPQSPLLGSLQQTTPGGGSFVSSLNFNGFVGAPPADWIFSPRGFTTPPDREGDRGRLEFPVNPKALAEALQWAIWFDTCRELLAACKEFLREAQATVYRDGLPLDLECASPPFPSSPSGVNDFSLTKHQLFSLPACLDEVADALIGLQLDEEGCIPLPPISPFREPSANYSWWRSLCFFTQFQRLCRCFSC